MNEYVIRAIKGFIADGMVVFKGETIIADEEAVQQLVDEEGLCEVVGSVDEEMYE